MNGELKTGVIILAAGLGRRMGGGKLLASLGGKPVIAHVADAVQDAGLEAIVVTGHDAEGVRNALSGRGLRFIHADDYAEGQAHSVSAGMRAVPDYWQAAIMALGDMPLIQPKLLRTMADRARSDAILIPRHEGHRGNPVLWGRDWFPALSHLTGDTGARQLFAPAGESLTFLDWPDDTILCDADTPEQLEALRKRIGA